VLLRACKVFYLLMKISGVFLITSAGRGELFAWCAPSHLLSRSLVPSAVFRWEKRKLDGKNFCLAVTREREGVYFTPATAAAMQYMC
jgi:hypothetical protein